MQRDTCYFDGRCGMCRRSTSVLRRLDWLGLLDFVDQSGVDPNELPVPPIEALEGMPMRTRDGRILVGFPAVRRALLQTPAGLVPALALYVPGIACGASAAYRWIARHRSRDIACTSASGC